MARSTPISIYRGEDVPIDFTAYTTDGGATAEDITGWTLEFTVSDVRNSTAAKLITKACSITVAASGTFRASLTDTETDNLQPGTYAWDVWRTDAGFERLLGEGAFVVKGNSRIPPAA